MNICVVGDSMTDVYVEVVVDRISPEAPVPVMREISRRSVPGGAANCARNVESLGGHVYLVSLGTDGGESFWPNGSWISESPRLPTVKTRYVANGQQIARLDVEERNSVGLAFWRKNGFQEIGKRTDHIAGVTLRNVEMEKSLR